MSNVPKLASLALLLAACSSGKRTDKPSRQSATAVAPDAAATATATATSDAAAAQPDGAPASSTTPAPDAIAWARQANLLANHQQLVGVIVPNWSATSGYAQRWQRSTDGTWHKVGDAWPIVVGKTGSAWGLGKHPTPPSDQGLLLKREGDGKSPAGVFAISAAFGYAPTASTPMPYRASAATSLCIDDAASRYYNQIIDATAVTQDWRSAETMRRRDGLYELGLVVDHNTPAGPVGASATVAHGSCIFLHVWRRATDPTVGCTAMSLAQLTTLAAWLTPASAPVVVLLPRQQWLALAANWGLPEL